MYSTVLGLVSCSLTATFTDAQGITYERKPVRLEEELSTPKKKAPYSPYVMFRVQEHDFFMDSRIFSSCFLVSHRDLDKALKGITDWEFADFEAILYSYSITDFSKNTLWAYLKVAKALKADDTLFEIEPFFLDISPEESLEILSGIVCIFGNLEKFPSRQILDECLSLLPPDPGYSPLFKDPMVKDWYQRVICHEDSVVIDLDDSDEESYNRHRLFKQSGGEKPLSKRQISRIREYLQYL